MRAAPPPPQSDEALGALLERSVEIVKGAASPPPAPVAALPQAAVTVGPVRFSAGPLGELFTAISAAQGEMTHAAKNGENPYFDSRYADLSACIDVGRPALARHGLAIVQFPSTLNGQAVVTSILTHSSGQWMASDLVLPASPPSKRRNNNGRGDQFEEAPKTPTAHSYGSGFSFGRRYAYQAITGLASADDDGNAASSGETPEEAPQRRQPQPAPARKWSDGRRDFDKRMARNHAAASGIDTGSAEPGTKEAAAHVAERKIAALRAERPAPELGTKSGEIKRAFAELEQRIGRARYNEALASVGVTDPLKLGGLERIKTFYRELASMAEEVA